MEIVNEKMGKWTCIAREYLNFDINTYTSNRIESSPHNCGPLFIFIDTSTLILMGKFPFTHKLLRSFNMKELIRRGHERTFGWNIDTDTPSDRVILLVTSESIMELENLISKFQIRGLCGSDGLLHVAVQLRICDILNERFTRIEVCIFVVHCLW